jgi:hypothetical protein
MTMLRLATYATDSRAPTVAVQNTEDHLHARTNDRYDLDSGQWLQVSWQLVNRKLYEQ